MKKNLLILMLTFCISNTLISQEQHKSLANRVDSVGLVLSGGGAKGLAHIGLLRMLDSLQVQTHYIAGTSMGGIMGGMYALGYTGDSIKSIVLKIDWDAVVSNKIPLSQINIEEKDEYDEYIVELPIIDKKPTLPSSMLEGQKLSQLINEFTFVGRHINSFKELPTPLLINSFDIINGKPVLIENGFLPLSLRSTMAIPAVFSPAIIGKDILVDGGLERNFPVNELLDKKCKYIIAGYSGFRLFTRSEVTNPIKMTFQTHAVKSVDLFNVEKKLVDILVDITNNAAQQYSSSQFNKYKEIIEAGEVEARKYIPELMKVAEIQRSLGIPYQRNLVAQKNLNITAVNIYNEEGDRIMPSEEKVLKSIIDDYVVSFNDYSQIDKAINAIYSTRKYLKVYYTLSPDGSGDDNNRHINFYVKKSASAKLSFGVHYDNDQSAGILLNYMYRSRNNLSRFISTIDISERFKFRANYYQFFGKGNDWWFKAGYEAINVKMNEIYLQLHSSVLNKADIPIYQGNKNIYVRLGKNLNTNTHIYLEQAFNMNRYYRHNAFTRIFVEDIDKNLFEQNNFFSSLTFERNTLNSKYFSTTGSYLKTSLNAFYLPNYTVSKNILQDSSYAELSGYLYPKDANELIKYNLQFYAYYAKNIPLHKQLTLKLKGTLGINNLNTKVGGDDFIFINQRFFAGGSEYQYLQENNKPFSGIRSSGIGLRNLAMVQAFMQYNPIKNLYITPSFSMFTIPFVENLKIKDALLYGLGLDLGYNTPIGPIFINYGYSNTLYKHEITFGFGYQF